MSDERARLEKQGREYRRLLQITEVVARSAGELIREAWNKPFNIEEKSPSNLVTEIDLRSEALIRSLLSIHTPEYNILGEEEGTTQGIVQGIDGSAAGAPSKRCWYVDPVDGTTNLAHRFDYFAVSIALIEDGVPLVGVVYNPIRDQLFRAAKGLGASLNGRPIHASPCPKLRDAMLATGFPTKGRDDASRNNRDNFSALAPLTQAIRRPGSAALDLAGVAAGWFDGFWELGLSPWDTAAGWLLVQEAGGTISKIDGAPFDPHHPECVASNGHIHPEMLKVLQDTRAKRVG